MSKSLSLLFSTEWCEQMACDLRESNAKKKRFAQKISIFCIFYTFFPFLCPRANLSLRSLLIRSLKKSKRGRFNKKKRAKGRQNLSDLLFLLFLSQKRVIGLKNQRANFQLWANPQSNWCSKGFVVYVKWTKASVNEKGRVGNLLIIFLSKSLVFLWAKEQFACEKKQIALL